MHYQKELLAVTYLLEDGENTVFYFTLSNDKVTALELSKGFWRKVKSLFPHSKHRRDYPAVKIGRLGVNTLYQHTDDKWGSRLLALLKTGWFRTTKLDVALSQWMLIVPQCLFI